jgi:hypothetical protein
MESQLAEYKVRRGRRRLMTNKKVRRWTEVLVCLDAVRRENIK